MAWYAMDNEEAGGIGRRVRQIRFTRQKPLRVIAELAGMSTNMLWRTERGERALSGQPRTRRTQPVRHGAVDPSASRRHVLAEQPPSITASRTARNRHGAANYRRYIFATIAIVGMGEVASRDLRNDTAGVLRWGPRRRAGGDRGQRQADRRAGAGATWTTAVARPRRADPAAGDGPGRSRFAGRPGQAGRGHHRRPRPDPVSAPTRGSPSRLGSVAVTRRVRPESRIASAVPAPNRR